MPPTLLRPRLSDQELLRRQQVRPCACRTLPDPAATRSGCGLGHLRGRSRAASASQLERISHPRLWDAVARPRAGTIADDRALLAPMRAGCSRSTRTTRG
jgi:hypothetical protein